MSRTAEEWGRVAVSLPGWRWMPGMRNDRGGRLVIGDESARRTPDHDDPATAGCLLALLGLGRPGWWVATTVLENGQHIVRASRWGHARVEGQALTLGRACIAAAEALGRWPNVAECGRMEAE